VAVQGFPGESLQNQSRVNEFFVLAPNCSECAHLVPVIALVIKGAHILLFVIGPNHPVGALCVDVLLDLEGPSVFSILTSLATPAPVPTLALPYSESGVREYNPEMLKKILIDVWRILTHCKNENRGRESCFVMKNNI